MAQLADLLSARSRENTRTFVAQQSIWAKIEQPQPCSDDARPRTTQARWRKEEAREDTRPIFLQCKQERPSRRKVSARHESGGGRVTREIRLRGHETVVCKCVRYL